MKRFLLIMGDIQFEHPQDRTTTTVHDIHNAMTFDTMDEAEAMGAIHLDTGGNAYLTMEDGREPDILWSTQSVIKLIRFLI